MQIFRYLFKNFFNDPRISDDRIRKFTTDHLKRLEQANENGVFALIITDTKAAYEEYFGAGTSTAGASDNLEELIWQFKVQVTEKESLIRNTFKKGSPAYHGFFPHGLAEYTKATKDTVGKLMGRFAEMAASYQKELGDGIASSFGNLNNSFRSMSKTNGANLVTAAVATTYRRAHLEQQLCRNLHYIAYHYAGDAEKCYALIDQSILRLRLAEEPEVFTGVIFFGATINVISMGITHHTTFRVRNIGQVPLRCCLGDTADSGCLDSFVEIAPRKEEVIPASQLGDPAVARFFNITNLSDDIGRYEVIMEE